MFKNTKIRTKLTFMVALLSVLIAAIGYMGLRGMAGASEGLGTVFNDRLIPTGQLARINDLMQENIRQLQLASMHDPRMEESRLHDHNIAMHTDRVEQNIAAITKIWEEYMATYLTPEEKRLADEYVAKRMRFVKEGLQPSLALYKAGKYGEANTLMVRVTNPAYLEAKQVAEKLMQLQMDVGKEEYDKAVTAYRITRNVSIAVIAFGVLLAVAVGFALIRGINRSLASANGIAARIAQGDLTSDIDASQKDEIGELLKSLKHMNDSLADIVSRVRQGTDVIATASGQIAAGNMDLSSRTEQQASSLEETASSMEELTSTVRQNADNARQANQLASTASDIAVRGGNVVSQVVETMGNINESSQKIADIISVIDGIAFQTNILALNAAVEAARAGEQGRGFAVVAAEVRNLAQRSASAAREIKTLIDDSVDKVEAGSRLVNDAGETMQEIVSSIQRVADIMGEITAASVEQSDGIEQVNQAVAQMDQVTQQNAALVEEAAAAAESLQDQAKNLVEVVSVFKTSGSDNQAGAIDSNVVSVETRKKPDLQIVRAEPKRLVASGGGRNAGRGEDWETF